MSQLSHPQLEIAVATKGSLREELSANGQSRHLDDGTEWIGHPGRQELWRLGRYFLLSRGLRMFGGELAGRESPPAFEEFNVVTRNGLGRGTQPRIYLRGRMLSWRVSLSHADEVFALAISRQSRCRVGIDVVDAAEATRASLRLWCTPAERKALRDQDDDALVQAWAMKEAVYKAVNRGEGFCPTHFEISSKGDNFYCHLRGEALPLEVAITRRLPEGGWMAAVVVSEFPHSRSLCRPA